MRNEKAKRHMDSITRAVSSMTLHFFDECRDLFEVVKRVPRTREIRGEVWREKQKGNGGSSANYILLTHNIVTGERIATFIPFQQGRMDEELNGFLSDLFLHMVKDRQEQFQEGPFASEFNERSIDSISLAIQASEDRIADRKKRSVFMEQKK